jgi:hypothetical protein
MGVQTAYAQGTPFPVVDLSPIQQMPGAFSGVVVNENWSQLEPSANQYDWSSLDASLGSVTAWNTAHPSDPLGVKLRIFAGRSAPSWVTAQSGTVTIVVHGESVTLGRWWTTPFETAWSTFQHALAARYDANPLVRQVSVSSCSSSTGEPFVISGALISRRNLAAAGWTPTAQEQCLSGALGDYSGWKQTPITFAFNPLPGPGGPSTTFMTEEMTACTTSAADGGPTCIIGNNDLSSVMASATYAAPVVQEISALEEGTPPPGVYFQTSGARLTCATINTGLAYHASSIELWPPRGNYLGFDVIPSATLQRWNAEIIAGARSVSC